LQDAGDAAAAVGAVPLVDLEAGAVDFLKLADDLLLLLLYELFHSQTHGGRLGDAGFALTETIALCNRWRFGVLYISGGLCGRVSAMVKQLVLSQRAKRSSSCTS